MTGHPAPTPALRTEGGSRYTFNIATRREADQHRLILHQVFFAQFFLGFACNLGTAVVAIFIGEFAHIILDQRQDLLGMRQQVFEIGDLLSDLFMLFFDLPTLQGCQAA